jgi:hypothetical protein
MPDVLAGVIAAGLDAASVLYYVLVRGQRFAIQQMFRRNPRRAQRRHHRRSPTLTMSLVLHKSFNFVATLLDLIDPPARIPFW